MNCDNGMMPDTRPGRKLSNGNALRPTDISLD